MNGQQVSIKFTAQSACLKSCRCACNVSCCSLPSDTGQQSYPDLPSGPPVPVQAAYISKLVKALRSDDHCCFGAQPKQDAAATLGDLATVDENRPAIVAAGAVPALLRLLWHSNSGLQNAALGVLWNLSVGGEAVKTAIAAAGATPLLM